MTKPGGTAFVDTLPSQFTGAEADPDAVASVPLEADADDETVPAALDAPIVQIEGLSLPRMRVLRPAGTWFAAWPVWIAAHVHGWAVLHKADAPDGQVVPLLRAYSGLHPSASSSLSWE